MKTLKELLFELNACKEAIKWVQDKTIEQAVAECERADWILWLAKKVQCNKRKLVLCGGFCANSVRHDMTDERSRKAVDTALSYGNGNATEYELDVASVAARAVSIDTLSAAETAAVRSAAWSSAGDSELAAARAASSAAARKIPRRVALKEMADIVRPIIADELIQKVNNLLQ